MGIYLYLSLMPESLVASMLPPEEFGAYLATGTLKRPHGQAMFFQLDRAGLGEKFDPGNVEQRCVPHPDGRPKHSVYLAIYRVLERVPFGAIGNLYLTTAHGRVLEIERATASPQASGKFHLYQELVPVHPLIASCLDPAAFCRLITDPAKPICVPKICFVELDLGGLADDPVDGWTAGLPYPNLGHIAGCLRELKPYGDKETKTVDRVGGQSLIYRCVKTGFYLGDARQVLYYAYPSREEMESRYYAWWRCANDAELARAPV